MEIPDNAYLYKITKEYVHKLLKCDSFLEEKYSQEHTKQNIQNSLCTLVINLKEYLNNII